MIYLTATGLTPGGSSTHLHTKQNIEQHKQTIHRTNTLSTENNTLNNTITI
jgi:hypothetical protein